MKNWRDCITAAAARLDDHKSSVMDIAVAIEPLCSTKEETLIDAINKEFLEKNAGIAANMSLKEMERVRQETHTSFRQTIGTVILPSVPPDRSRISPLSSGANSFSSCTISVSYRLR